jgi:hypothetical protein
MVEDPTGFTARRRRRMHILAAAAIVVVTVGAGLVVSESSRRGPAPPTVPIPTPSVRAVTDDPYFPREESGARRVSVVDWQVGERPIMLTWSEPQARAFLRVYCTHTGGTVPQLLVTHGRATDYLACVGQDWPGGPQRLWLMASDGGRVLVGARGANAVGTARIALYEQQPSSTATAAPEPPPHLDSDPRTSWSSVSEAGPVFGPPRPSSANRPLTITGRYEPGLMVSLVVRGPGTLVATANGHPLVFSCQEDADDILGCPADGVLGRRVQPWGYGALAHVYFAFENLAGLGPGSPITITVQPSGFTGDDWRVSMLLDRGEGALPPTTSWSTP